jgi:hypothetical protein
VQGGPIWDCRLIEGELGQPTCPFRDETHMDLQLSWNGYLKNIAEFKTAHETLHSVVFTRGDVAMRNVLVQGTQVTDLLDWESAGGFPNIGSTARQRLGALIMWMHGSRAWPTLFPLSRWSVLRTCICGKQTWWVPNTPVAPDTLHYLPDINTDITAVLLSAQQVSYRSKHRNSLLSYLASLCPNDCNTG